MKKIAWLLAGALALPAQAQSSKWTVAHVIDDWEINTRTDKITDKISCLITHKSNSGVQWYPQKRQLYLGPKARQTPISGQIRFGKDAPFNWRASQIEKEIHSVIIEGASYASAEAKKTLFARVVTLLGAEVEFDLDLSQVDAVKQKTQELNCAD
jgi:hypothetical protein